MTTKRRRLTSAERLAKAEAQEAKAKKTTARAKAQITADKRKQANGRKIVAGAHLLEWIKDDAGLRTRLIDALAQSGRTQDRARFPEYFDEAGTRHRRPEALPSPPVPPSPPVAGAALQKTADDDSPGPARVLPIDIRRNWPLKWAP